MSKHLAEKTLQLMTIKELSVVLGVSERLIQKRVKELFPDLSKKGHTTYLTEKHVTAIKLRIEENSSLATTHDRSKLAKMPKTKLEEDLLIQQAMQIQSNRISLLQEELQNATQIIELNAPKVKLAEDSIRDKDKHYSITNAGKQLGLKQTFIFNLMKEKHLLTVDKLPTQSAINRKMLTLRTNIVAGKNRPQAVMTMENIYNFKNVYEKDFK